MLHDFPFHKVDGIDSKYKNVFKDFSLINIEKTAFFVPNLKIFIFAQNFLHGILINSKVLISNMAINFHT